VTTSFGWTFPVEDASDGAGVFRDAEIKGLGGAVLDGCGTPMLPGEIDKGVLETELDRD